MAGRRRLMAIVLVVVLVAVGAGVALSLKSRTVPPPPPARVRPTAAQKELALETRIVADAGARVSLDYPTTDDQPAPLWTSRAFDAALPKHVVFGFVPYYSLGQLTSADYLDVSTMAYDGVELTANGGLDEQPVDLGWEALRSPAFAALVAEAHQDHDQVLVTVFTETPSVINAITAHPAASGKLLAEQLQPVLADDRLDGVDVDVEGSGKADRPGFVSFMQSFTAELHSTDPSAVIVLDTYPGSAADSGSFFDVAALAPLVNTMFVMAYDMYQPGQASPNAPLASPILGLSDVQSLVQYTAVVKPSKLVLGVPFYGYDFATRSGNPRATSNSPPEAVTWQSIVEAGHQALWDPQSDTPWYGYKLKGHWHETYFDDPASIALKTALAAQMHLEGVGVWSLGMEGGDDAMLNALLGGAPAEKLPLTASAVLSAGGDRGRGELPS
jgi:hypothetical protein